MQVLPICPLSSRRVAFSRLSKQHIVRKGKRPIGNVKRVELSQLSELCSRLDSILFAVVSVFYSDLKLFDQVSDSSALYAVYLNQSSCHPACNAWGRLPGAHGFGGFQSDQATPSAQC